MAGPVIAEVGDRAWWIRSGDRAIPSRFHAATTVDGFSIRLFAVVGERGPGAVEVTIEQPDGGKGEPVTHRVLRKLTTDQIVRDALAQLSRPVTSAEDETGIPGTFRVEGIEDIYGGRAVSAPGRGRDTEPDRLARVAEIYRSAVAAGRPPVKAVTDELPSSRSTAGRLVGQARKAGLLRETTHGRVGADAPAEEA